jgi:peptide deformylase
MEKRSILKMGNPQLFEKSLRVADLKDPLITQIITEMTEAMQRLGGVGIAAPQIGYKKRIMIFGFERSERYPDEKPVPFTILINPVFTPLSEVMNDGWEGCLSVPGLRGLIPRFSEIKYEGLDPQGNKIEREASNFHARMIQHECDHLDGILFPQRIKDLKRFGFEDALPEFSQHSRM